MGNGYYRPLTRGMAVVRCAGTDAKLQENRVFHPRGFLHRSLNIVVYSSTRMFLTKRLMHRAADS